MTSTSGGDVSTATLDAIRSSVTATGACVPATTLTCCSNGRYPPRVADTVRVPAATATGEAVEESGTPSIATMASSGSTLMTRVPTVARFTSSNIWSTAAATFSGIA